MSGSPADHDLNSLWPQQFTADPHSYAHLGFREEAEAPRLHTERMKSGLYGGEEKVAFSHFPLSAPSPAHQAAIAHKHRSSN